MGILSLVLGLTAITSVGGVIFGPIAFFVGVLTHKRAAVDSDRKLGRVGAWLGAIAFVVWSLIVAISIVVIVHSE